MPATAQTMDVSVTIPRLTVAEYHKPYVAIWVEKPDGAVAANLAVWYDTKLKEKEGEKWLKDIRQWWRRTGRELTLPVDGVSGPTRAPGVQTVEYAGDAAPLNALEPGDYTLFVEASREVGGREMVEIDFTWPTAAKAETKGTSELGVVTLEIK